jgi:mRNA-degrading endonuclease toxin of MazEF toxin-antitoxin module
MTSGTSLKSPRQGELWTAYTPGQPDDPHQPRPVLVISEDVRNRLRDDVIVVPAFSGGRLGPTRVPVPAKSGGLPHDSVLFCEEVTTIDKELLQRGPLGPGVEPGTLAAVVRAIRRAIGEVVPS